MRRSWWLAAMAVVALGGVARAQDANAAIAADDCMVSMKSNAVIEVSGQFDLVMKAHHVEGVGGHYNVTEYQADTADLTLTVKPMENAYLTVTMDLDAAWNGRSNAQPYEQDDFLKEMYFTFENIANTGFGVKAGKMGLPFGYDKDVLLVSPYLDGNGESAFAKEFNGYYGNATGNWLNLTNPTYTDRQFAITPYYNWCDKLLVEFSLFQNSDARDINGVRRRSNDNMLFKSMAAAITWTPIEDLNIKVSGMTKYYDANKNGGAGSGWPNGMLSTRSKAISAAIDYTFQVCGRDLNVFAEYVYGWDNPYLWGNSTDYFDNDSNKSHDIHFGGAYDLTDKLTLHAQGEWLQQKQKYGSNWGGGWDKQTLWRAVVALQYEMCSGIVLEGGWQHEWLRLKDAWGAKLNKDADTFFAGIRYTF